MAKCDFFKTSLPPGWWLFPLDPRPRCWFLPCHLPLRLWTQKSCHSEPRRNSLPGTFLITFLGSMVKFVSAMSKLSNLRHNQHPRMMSILRCLAVFGGHSHPEKMVLHVATTLSFLNLVRSSCFEKPHLSQLKRLMTQVAKNTKRKKKKKKKKKKLPVDSFTFCKGPAGRSA